MRDITKLHPTLQEKVAELQKLCEKQGLKIGISECVRSVAEQDELYAQGRTKPGQIVTNAKGSTYSSMHMWGVAFDFYRNDGKGAYENKDKFFEKVGRLGQSIGLEWGGSWKSFVDLPHFQLPNWGSTTAKLKAQYGTPNKFFLTWNNKTVSKTSATETKSSSKNEVEIAKKFDKTYAKTYTATSNLNLRTSSNTSSKDNIIMVLDTGTKVSCYGYYNIDNGIKWLLVSVNGKLGYCSMKYLK